MTGFGRERHLTLARVRLTQGHREEARAILDSDLLRAATLPASLQRDAAVLSGQVSGDK